MKKLLSLIIILTSILTLCSCSIERDPNYAPPEQPHLYWKDIDVVVTDVSKASWFATVRWNSITISVKSEEYGLEQSFSFKSSGAFNTIDCWDYQVGDTIKAELYSWVMDSTGEVIRRSIHKIY